MRQGWDTLSLQPPRFIVETRKSDGFVACDGTVKLAIEAVVELTTAVLIRRSGAATNGPVTQLVRRLQGVLVARRYVMLAYDVRADNLDAAANLTPGIESPTISPLHREGWVAVQAMVLRSEVHKIMDELYEIGARAILVTDIHACRL